MTKTGIASVALALASIMSMIHDTNATFIEPMVMLDSYKPGDVGNFSVYFSGIDLKPTDIKTTLASRYTFELDLGTAKFQVEETIDVDGNKLQASVCSFTAGGTSYPMNMDEGVNRWDVRDLVVTPMTQDDNVIIVPVPVQVPVYSEFVDENGDTQLEANAMSFSCSNIKNPRQSSGMTKLFLKSGTKTLVTSEIMLPEITAPTIGSSSSFAIPALRTVKSPAANFIIAVSPFPTAVTSTDSITITLPTGWSVATSSACASTTGDGTPASGDLSPATLGKADQLTTITFKPKFDIPVSGTSTYRYIHCTNIQVPSTTSGKTTAPIVVRTSTNELLIDGTLGYSAITAAGVEPKQRWSYKHDFGISQANILKDEEVAKLIDAYRASLEKATNQRGFRTPLTINLLSQTNSTKVESVVKPSFERRLSPTLNKLGFKTKSHFNKDGTAFMADQVTAEKQTNLSLLVSFPVTKPKEVFEIVFTNSITKTLTTDAINALGMGNGFEPIDSSNPALYQVEDTCYDGQINGDETDIDCGGSCFACLASKKCAENSDCASMDCNSNKCRDGPGASNAVSQTIFFSAVLVSVVSIISALF